MTREGSHNNHSVLPTEEKTDTNILREGSHNSHSVLPTLETTDTGFSDHQINGNGKDFWAIAREEVLKDVKLEKLKDDIAREHADELEKETLMFFEKYIVPNEINLMGGKLSIIKFIIQGEDKFDSELLASSTNNTIIASLIAGTAVGNLLVPISKSDMCGESACLSSFASSIFTHIYYVSFCLSAFSNLLVVLLCVMSMLHYTLMISPSDKMWFVDKWDNAINVLPQILLMLGVISLFVGLCVGSFLVSNTAIGIIVCSLASLFVAIFLYIWSTMLRANFARTAKSLEIYKKIYTKIMSQRRNEYSGKPSTQLFS